MRILENTRDRLALRIFPFGLALALLALTLLLMLWGWALWRAGQPKGGLALCGIGLLVFVGCFGGFVRILHVTLDRQRNLAEIVERGLFGTKRTAHLLQDLHGATLQSKVVGYGPDSPSSPRRSNRKPRPERRVWRAALVHRNGQALPLTEIYGSQTSAGAAASAINGWFGRPDPGSLPA